MVIIKVRTQSLPEKRWAEQYPWEYYLHDYNSVGKALVEVHTEFNISFFLFFSSCIEL